MKGYKESEAKGVAGSTVHSYSSCMYLLYTPSKLQIGFSFFPRPTFALLKPMRLMVDFYALTLPFLPFSTGAILAIISSFVIK